jgi:hypothetical protein
MKIRENIWRGGGGGEKRIAVGYRLVTWPLQNRGVSRNRKKEQEILIPLRQTRKRTS